MEHNKTTAGSLCGFAFLTEQHRAVHTHFPPHSIQMPVARAPGSLRLVAVPASIALFTGGLGGRLRSDAYMWRSKLGA